MEGDLSRNQAGCQEIMQPGSNGTCPYQLPTQHGTDWRLEELIIGELEGNLPSLLKEQSNTNWNLEGRWLCGVAASFDLLP